MNTNLATSSPPRPSDQDAFQLRCYRSQREISPGHWQPLAQQGTVGLDQHWLSLLEQSRVNQLEPAYLLFSNVDNETVGLANVYGTQTDFATMDSTMPAKHRAIIKSWFPDFMKFRVLECGLFTSVGESVTVADPASKARAIQKTAEFMQKEALERGFRFQVFRDIDQSNYNLYAQVLQPLGYYPTLGFANAALKIQWSDLESYLQSCDHKVRYKLRSSLRTQEKLGITIETTAEFSELAPKMARLWRNVNESASEYSREKLDEDFFVGMANDPGKHAEAVLFRYEGKLVAFMLNIVGQRSYTMLDWGVDYSFEHYRKANLYRAASVISLQRAIELHKGSFEMGITNYVPKRLLGAELQPLVYFVKGTHSRKEGQCLVKLISKSILQPDELRLEDVDISDCLQTKVELSQNLFRRDDVLKVIESDDRANELRLADIYGFFPQLSSGQAPSIQIRGENPMVNLGSNNYLGLSIDEGVKARAIEAIEHYGTGCSGSPLLNGTLELHVELATKLAQHVGQQSALVFSTGYQANLAAISTLCKARDTVAILDIANHRSLFDAVKFAGCKIVTYGHNNTEQLERILRRYSDHPSLVVADSVFSMEGTIANLPEIVRLVKQYNSRLYLDESHAVGVCGANGGGVAQMYGLEQDVDAIMGTFSKSLATMGGFVAGSEDMVDFLKHNASGYVFSASLAPPVAAGALAALEAVQSQPQRRERVLHKAAFMAEKLQEMGFRATFHGVPIVPVAFGCSALTMAAFRRLYQLGVYVNPVAPPAVPQENTGFRTSYMATHEWDHIHLALNAFEQLAQEMSLFKN